MRKKLKRILSSLLAVVMILCAMPVSGSMLTAGAAENGSTINIGDCITLGTYNGEPIVWRCVDIDDNGPLMLSEKVLCEKEFDAKGTDSFYHTDGWGYVRRENGSNCWSDSNVRQWLNSSGLVEYSHCPPSYAAEVGFLSSFDDSELAVIKSVTQAVTVNEWETHRNGYVDGGTKESKDVWNIPALGSLNMSVYWFQNVTDKVFLLGEKQLFSAYNNLPDVITSCGYITRIANNTGASYDMVRTVIGNGTALGSITAYMMGNIRPAFYLDVEKYSNREQFPDGYDFYEDSYNFGNFGDTSLSKKYFSGLFSSANMEEIYKYEKKAGGLCCGFAYTTAAIYNNIPSATSIFDKSLIGSPTYANSLRDVKKSSKINVGDNTISVSDYIKYAYVYQLSEDVTQQRMNTGFTSTEIQGYEFLYNKEGIFNLYNLVGAVTNDNNLGVIIWLNGLDVADSANPGCHTVLCVGVDNDGILIDDSNLRESNGFTDELGHLRINEDGTWVYEPYNGKYNSGNTWISYAMDYHKPYSILSTGNKVIADDTWIDDDNTGNSYIVGCEKIDIGKGILYCNADDYQLNDIEKTKFLDIGSGENSDEDAGKLYWVNSDDTITITNIKNAGSDAEFHLSSGDTITAANVSDSSSITFNSDNSINIDSVINDEYTISYAYCFEDDNYEDKVVRIAISCTASDEFILAKQTNDGIEITGISDGTVTLSKDDEVIETQEISNATSDIEITYDKTGENDDVSLDYETSHEHSYTSEVVDPTCTEDGRIDYICSCGDTYTEILPATGHADSDADGKCDICGETLEAVKNCTHLCHKTGFLGFIWKIVNIFNKLFEINPVCSCGMKHY